MAKKISPYGIDKEERGREPSSLQHYEHYYYIPQPSHQLVSLRRRAATTASSDQVHPCGILHYSILTNRYPTALVSLASTSARARKIITRVLPYCIACLYERARTITVRPKASEKPASDHRLCRTTACFEHFADKQRRYGFTTESAAPNANYNNYNPPPLCWPTACKKALLPPTSTRLYESSRYHPTKRHDDTPRYAFACQRRTRK